MSTIFKTIQGDTFESISRKEYGSEDFAGLIRQSNPGLKEPFAPGIYLTIPAQPDAPQNISQAGQSNNNEEVALLINGERFRFWDSIRITRSIDAMDLIDFGAPFESSNKAFRDIFRPLSYQDASFTVGGKTLFTGTVVSPDPVIEQKKKTVMVSGYSLPRVLNDCSAPASAYAALNSLEFNNQGLKDISITLSALFGLSVDFQADQGPVFERVSLAPNKKVLEFLSSLARKRNIIISSTPQGKLLFQQSIDSGIPKANLRQGESPLLGVTPLINPQEYYSHITGIVPDWVGVDGDQFTVKNPHLNGVIRPFTFQAPNTEDGDIKLAVEAKAGRMFANIISYNIPVNTWRDPAGELWTPNTIINLIAPDAMVYNKYDFLLRTVTFEKTRAAEKATLNLVMPGAFSGKIPETLPWAE